MILYQILGDASEISIHLIYNTNLLHDHDTISQPSLKSIVIFSCHISLCRQNTRCFPATFVYALLISLFWPNARTTACYWNSLSHI